jgi:hypothetical protein
MGKLSKRKKKKEAKAIFSSSARRLELVPVEGHGTFTKRGGWPTFVNLIVVFISFVKNAKRHILYY